MMNYKDIVAVIESEKLSNTNNRTPYVEFDDFCVCFTGQGLCFLVDKQIAPLISHRKWCLSHGYPATRIKKELVRLHDYVMAKSFVEKPDGWYVDHVNQNKRDNRKCNLRIVSPSESAMNLPMKSDNSSGVVGVCKAKNGMYRAYITIDQKQICLGYYNTIEEAAEMRRKVESRLGFKTRPYKT